VKLGRSVAELLDLVWRHILNHPHIYDGPSILLKLHIDRVYTVQDIANDFYILPVWLLCLSTPLLGEFFFGILPPNEFRYCRNTQNDHPWATTRRMSYKPWKPVLGFDPVACPRKNTVSNQPTNQNISLKTAIFHLSGEKPLLNGLEWKFALVYTSRTYVK